MVLSSKFGPVWQGTEDDTAPEQLQDLAELVRTLRTKGDPESVITVPNLLGDVITRPGRLRWIFPKVIQGVKSRLEVFTYTKC